MSFKFKEIDRHTPYLFPPSVEEWLPQEHQARFILDIIGQLDLSAITTSYSGRGKQAYHPEVLLALLFYGYANGVFSSRKLEQATYDSVAFRFITANQQPDHDTIAHFRKRFLGELEALFVQVLVIAKEMHCLTLGTVSLDGTKIKANASKHKALSWGYANKLEEQLRAEIKQLLAQADAIDAQEDAQYDDNIPDELCRREDRLKAIAKAKKAIEQRAQDRLEDEQAAHQEKLKQREESEKKRGRKHGGRPPAAPVLKAPKDSDQTNLSDEQSRIMPSHNGFVQAYNAQAAVDLDTHLVLENHVTQSTNDMGEILPALKKLGALDKALGSIDGLLADTGYCSEKNVEACEDATITPYIASHRQPHNQALEDRRREPLPCPEGADAMTSMKYRLQTVEGKALYAKRKSTVETVLGVIKQAMGFRQFLLRGHESVTGEWNLVCLAWNLKRLHRLQAL